MDFWTRLLDTSDFPPRWHCGNWSTGHGWLHVLSDLGVFSAYFTIPCVLGYFLLRRRDLPFRMIFVLFAAFILACGTTHLMEALMFWWPAYRLAGLIKLLTALVSWVTIFALIQVTPKILTMRSAADLQREVDARRDAEDALALANAELEGRVRERTAELEAVNAALRHSEERLGLALQAGGMGTWEWDVATGRVVWSPTLEAIHGLAPGTFPGDFEAYQRDIHPEDRDHVLGSIARALEQGKDYRVEYRIVWPDGGVHWIEARGELHRDDAGRPLRMMGVCMDVDERKAAEEEVRFQAHLLDSVQQAAVATDPERRIIYWNRFAETLYGWASEEVIGRDILDVTPAPESAGEAARVMELLLSGANWSGEFAVRRRDGSTFPALVTNTPVLDGHGHVQAVIGISADITERKRVEQALRFLADASATLARLVDYESTLQKVAALAVPHFADWCAVDIADGDGPPRRLAVAHADPDKVRLAHELEQRYPPDPDSPHGVPEVLRTGRPDLMEDIPDELLVRGARDGEHLRILRELGLKSYMCVPLRGRSGLMGVVSFMLAESGRRYTRADLPFAEELARRAATAVENARLYAEVRAADRRKDEFLATLAHELRNPLAPIRNSLQILKMAGVDPDTLRQTRDMMERQVQQLVRLVDDLLDVSRVMRGKVELRRERVGLAAVVARAAETARPLIDARGHEFTVDLPDDPLPLHADPVRLAQAVGNLLTNAAKYTEPGGSIRVTAARAGGAAVLRVRDTGIGIEPDLLPRVFDLFVQADHSTTRSQGGLGIGLTLVKSLVEMHGGTVEAHSEGPGRGSEFVVKLPLAADPEPPAVAGDATGGRSAPPAGRRILVVDDNPDGANSLAMLLRLDGHLVRVAHDGPAGLQAAADFRPQLVLLDIGMPGMDGYEVAGRLRELPGLEHVRLAALTGWGQLEDRRRSQEAGFDHHFVKPVDFAALEQVLASLGGG